LAQLSFVVVAGQSAVQRLDPQLGQLSQR